MYNTVTRSITLLQSLQKTHFLPTTLSVPPSEDASNSSISNLNPTDQNIIDRDMYDFHEEAYEPHYQETNPRGSGNMRELFSVRFCTLRHQVLAVTVELR